MKKDTKSRLMKSLLTGSLVATIGVGSGILGSELQKKELEPVIQKYEQTLDSQSAKIDELINAENELKTQNTTLSDSLALKNAKIEELLKDSENFVSIIKDLTDQLSMCPTTESVQELIDNYTKQISSYESKIQELEEMLQNNTNENSQKIDELENSVQELLNKINELKQSTIEIFKTNIDIIREYVDSKEVHSASDRSYVHSQITNSLLLLDNLHKKGQISESEFNSLDKYVETIEESYVYKNILNSIQTYQDSDFYALNQIITYKDGENVTQHSAYSKTQAYAYGNIFGNKLYGVINNGISQICTGSQYNEFEYNTESVKEENLNGMIMELESMFNNYDTAIDYNTSEDSYTISRTITTNENNDLYTNFTYDIDENGDLASYNVEDDELKGSVIFGTITESEFNDTFAIVNAKVQEEKARIEESQAQQQ